MSEVGDKIDTKRASWTFGDNVAETFDNHVEKSIPGYHEGQSIITTLSDYFVKDDSVCYDLGCSTGAVAISLAHQFQERGFNSKFVGIDVEERMIEVATKKKNALNLENLELICEDLLSYDYLQSDFITSYYTIQFIRPSQRQELINKIFESLKWGGAFVMFEKTRAPDARFQDIFVGLYDEYKLEQGYTSDQIFSKTRSLRGVMEPFSTKANFEMLERAGFKDTITLMKNISFEGFLAIK